MANIIYWVGYAGLVLIGVVVSWFQILPVNNTVVLMLGIMQFWDGLTLLLKLNDHLGKKYNRASQEIISYLSMGLGAVWCSISLTPLSNRFVPMVLVSAPFVAGFFAVYLHHKKDNE